MSDEEHLCGPLCEESTCSNSGKIVYKKVTTTTITRFGKDTPTVEEVNDALLMYNLNQGNLDAVQNDEISAITPAASPSKQNNSKKEKPTDVEQTKNSDEIKNSIEFSNNNQEPKNENENEFTEEFEGAEESKTDKNVNENVGINEANRQEVDQSDQVVLDNKVNISDSKNLLKSETNTDDHICKPEICKAIHDSPQCCISSKTVTITDSPKKRKCNIENCPTLTNSSWDEFDSTNKQLNESLKDLREHIEKMTTEDIEMLTDALEAQLNDVGVKLEESIPKTSNQTSEVMTPKQKQHYKIIEKRMDDIIEKLEQPYTDSNIRTQYRNSNFRAAGSTSRYQQPLCTVDNLSFRRSCPTSNQTTSIQRSVEPSLNFEKFYQRTPSIPQYARPVEYTKNCTCVEEPYQTRSLPNTSLRCVPVSPIQTYGNETINLSPSGTTIIRKVRTTTIITSTPIYKEE